MPFECAYACEVKVSDCAKIEKTLHKAFEPNRVNANREFFNIKPKQATAILGLFDRKDITNEVTAEIENDLTPEDKAAGEKIKTNRRPPLNFREMGIQPNSILTFVNDPSVCVTVIADKKVSYNDNEISLTAITKQLLGLDYAVQPIKYWVYDGKNVRDIYDETYTLEE